MLLSFHGVVLELEVVDAGTVVVSSVVVVEGVDVGRVGAEVVE